MSQIRINEIGCYYEKKGKKKQTVILLHGWGQSTVMMDFIAEFLKSHFTVYNIDMPGFGQSEDPKEPFGVEDYSEFLRTFCVEKKIEDPIIIAHSFGCRIALHYARKYPVHKMVLTGAAGVRDKRGFRYYLKTYSYKLGKKILSLKPFRKYKEKWERQSGSLDYQNAHGVMRGTFVKVVNDDVTSFLPEIRPETLLVYGDQDIDTPLWKGKLMEEKMPDATLVTFEGDDHWAYFHQADRFNRVLEAFLKSDYE